MSQQYIRRLRKVQDDLKIALELSEFVRHSWHRQDISGAFPERTLSRIKEAEEGLPTAYFVRLTAESEGILRDHLQTNHPQIAVPANRRDWTVDWFLRRVLQQENVVVSPELRQRLDQVRNYRNAVAHGNQAIADVSFGEALARYNTFLARLSEPLR